MEYKNVNEISNVDNNVFSIGELQSENNNDIGALLSDSYDNIKLTDSTSHLTKIESLEDYDENDLSYKIQNINFNISDDFDEYENGSNEPKEAPPGWKGIKFYLSLSSYWFAYAAVMSALISIVWPSQIAYLGGQENKEKYVGIIPILAVAVSIVISPLSGALSDHSTSRYGRRRIYIVTGSVVCLVFLFLTSLSPNIYIFMLMIMGIEFGINFGGTPYTSLMPDLVPKSKYGLASGYLALGNALGNLFGVLGSGVCLMIKKSYLMVYIFLIIIFGIFNLPTLIVIKEKPVRASPDQPKLTFKRFIKSFYLPSSEYRDFYWVIITRFLQEMGIYSILPFIQFYLGDIIHVEKESLEFYASVFISIIVLTSIPSSIIGGPLSDKYGRKLLVYISSAIMATVTVGFILVALRPNVIAVMVLSGLFGVGYGSYQSVDYAIALDVLPENSNTAKDMGIWHQTMVVPQLLGPALSGFIIDRCKKNNNIVLGYTLLFSLATFWFFLATIMIKPIRIGKREQFIRLENKS
ncbi:hypothetical protein DLAC_01137 [Tieghemostelium lacteum]|uniref:Major facilitator superfamily (MFS) profile domain-containing protein n=1 Tax=Tieghemostelium lacteum TaxID=361077 RepID=A0A152A852_TIELA|nr:hypothetical protein DLAC_01137 [Tieghemostelium lacteum]|eukprot:KYR02305.1 hypothetical protein DLAC_01137 [Tieghemostelium lacteum]